MTVDDLNRALLFGTLVLLVAVPAVRLSVLVGLPSLLFYLAIGLVLGEDVIGIRFDDAQLAQLLGLSALVVILAEGGLTTRWNDLRPTIGAASVLSTVGVAVSITVTAVGTRLLLDVEWRLAFLLGAIVSSTDAAAVFSVLRRLRIRPRLAGLLEAESGLNDAPVVIVVLLLSESHPGGRSPALVVGLLGYELAAGAAIGLAAGWLGAQALRHAALPASGLYPLSVLALCVLGYAGAASLNASGFLAVYLAALVLGNAELPHRPATRSFAEGLAWLAQIGLFVMLGLLATPSDLPRELLPALGVGGLLLLVARPASVLVAASAFGYRLREQAFLSWAGLRGAVPIVLATIPVTNRVAESDRIFDLVFILVVVFTLVQGPTLPWIGRRLGVLTATAPRDLDVESAPLTHLGASLLEMRVTPGSRLNGLEIFELRLPQGAAVTLVVRDGQSFVPIPTTRLRTDDELLVVATEASRAITERRLQAVSRAGRLAGWLAR